MKENRLLDRIVEELNLVFMYNTDKHERIFTVERRYFTVHNPDVNALTESPQTTYRIYLNHHEVGCLVFETFVQEGKHEESEESWLILEERVMKTLASYAVFGATNLVEQTKRLRRI